MTRQAEGHLGVGRARPYQPRTDYLKDKPGYQPKASGGDRHEDESPEVIDFPNTRTGADTLFGDNNAKLVKPFVICWLGDEFRSDPRR